MDPALRALLTETVQITPTGPPASGGFGTRVKGVPTSLPARIRGGTRKLLDPSGKEVVSAHEIRLDGDADLLPANAVQTIGLTGATDADTYKLTFRGQLTGPLRKDAAPADVQAALVALSTIGAGNATVTGAARGPYTVSFGGALAGQQLPLLVASAATGGLAVAIAGVNPDGTPRAPRPLDLATMADGTTYEVALVDPAADETGACATYRVATRPT